MSFSALFFRSVHIVLFIAWQTALGATQTPPDATTPDGGRYYGPLANGKLQGRGRLEWGNGARYEGEFVNGVISGQGKLWLANGDVYEGEFRNGMLWGRGRFKERGGSVYVGDFANDLYHGQGRYESTDGGLYVGAFENGRPNGYGQYTGRSSQYRGHYKDGLLSGQGEIAYSDGRKYRGEFAHGEFHGTGRFEMADGQVYEGQFVDGQFVGKGTYTRIDGARYEGEFRNWRMHGAGALTDAGGNVYRGNFVDGELNGQGKFLGKDGSAYEGEFKQWRFHGRGVYRNANGDVYEGEFADGLFEGKGTLKYAKPRDGRTEETGIWHYGAREGDERRIERSKNVELALYTQRPLLDKTLSGLLPRDPARINMYFLAVAGDGSQEVFRREVEFIQQQFDREFGTKGRSITLVNSRSTVATLPMATHTSLRESLQAVAERMDKEKDIFFLFMTSHGSRDHELTLSQNGINLRSLKASELKTMLDETGIRWKAIVVSACYSGGFIDKLKDDHTLVITAARHDRRSFGCADENDFTHFGRAFFKEALPESRSFDEAFKKAESLVKEWEKKENKKDETDDEGLSLPQIHSPRKARKHLQKWWAQQATASDRLSASGK